MKRYGMKTIRTAVAAGALCGLLAAAPAQAGAFAEPSTVFYGKIVGTGSVQPFPVTEGQMDWTLRRSDGVDLVFRVALYPLNRGEFSYRLDVPHTALALGLVTATDSVPLAANRQTHSHLAIRVNGLTASIVGPGGPVFDADQARRAATYRLDLAVPLVAIDTDGDGMADWWEDKHGLDKQDPSDAAGDLDGDGVGNLQEYLNGTDPNRDNRQPVLATSMLRVYASGLTGVRLNVLDSDSVPADLLFTLDSAPASGALVLRNALPAGPDSSRNLVAGDTFTQADVLQGRLVYAHSRPDDGLTMTQFAVTVRDEDPTHPAGSGTVALYLYRPTGSFDEATLAAAVQSCEDGEPSVEGAGAPDRLADLNYLLSRELGFVIWDASAESAGQALSVPSSGLTPDDYQNLYVPQYGADLPQVLWGGSAGDTLRGGMESDILVDGQGNDVLTGNGGRDLFVIGAQPVGVDRIADFSLAGGDAIDVSGMAAGASEFLTDYVRLLVEGTNSVLFVNAAGAVAAGPNHRIEIPGSELAVADLYDLVEAGTIRVGDKILPSRVEISVVTGEASENGPVPAEFQLRRRGDCRQAISVGLLLTGSAQNGVDYVYVPGTISFAAGQETASIVIMPYLDAISEWQEVVAITVVGGSGYRVGPAASASVTISDLLPLISVEALEPVAVQDPLQPGAFLIRRAAILDRSVLVRLQVQGTAVAGVDYTSLPSYVNLLPNQTTHILDVVPKAGADLSAGAKSVDLGIRPDATYTVASSDPARVLLVRERIDFPTWTERYDPVVSQIQSVPGLSLPSAGDEVPAFWRYAFGLNPSDPGDTAGLPALKSWDGWFAVMFKEPASALGLRYIVEVSDDLVSWQGGADRVERLWLPEYAGEPERVVYRSRRPMAEKPRQYIRVRVAYEQPN